ncbi:hemerythrin domain-containing protein [Ideonella oryzae]|uniref:Hemerythrin domain-containing protein n=1 Tax=Ideonella oryzae TaxID=2937441 RepID=A0ABT1BJN8_9BURK|nr:hemerythrin domain-containing protein [Ideonella oryzae]MCO5976420.1 hemerythrin domain-containing protein [Ideonella oryzae]
MSALAWSEELVLQHPQMDATHEEFVELLNVAQVALARSEAEGLAAWDALVEHTIGHFGQEDRWMLATGFAKDNCHSRQHDQVLAIMQEVARLARDHQDFGPLQRIIPELAAWFSMHAQSMDSSLAVHLQVAGFDPATGLCQKPQAVDAAPISGCGSDHCAPDHASA